MVVLVVSGLVVMGGDVTAGDAPSDSGAGFCSKEFMPCLQSSMKNEV